MGKSYCTKLIVDKMLIRDNKRTTIVIVPTIPLKSQWEKKVKEWKMKNTTVYVINSVVLNKINLNTTLLVLDEMHMFASEEFIKIFELVKYNFLLGLTATVDRLDGRHKLLLEKAPIVDSISIQEAKDNGWVADYIEYNLGLELNEADQSRYNQLKKSFNLYFSKFGYSFEDAMACMNSVKAREYALKKGFDVKDVSLWAIQFNRFMRLRKDFLYNTEIKKEVCKELINKLKLKTVVFSESTEFADKLTEELGDIAVCYHSNIKTQIIDGKKFGKDRLKKHILKQFADKRTKKNVLVTARALNQGLDVEDVELVIIASYNRNSTSKTQRTGRGTRVFKYTSGINKGKNKIAIIVNLYIKKSQDEKWLKECQTDPKTKLPLNPDIIEIENLNEISYEHVKSATISLVSDEDEILE